MSNKYRDFAFTKNNDFLETHEIFLSGLNSSLQTLDGDDAIYATFKFYNGGRITTGTGNDSISIKRESDGGDTNSVFFNKGIVDMEEGSDIIKSIQTGGNAAIYNQKISVQEPGIINTGGGDDHISGFAGNVGIMNEGGTVILDDGDDIIEGEGRIGLYNMWQSTKNYIGSISTGNGNDSITGKGSIGGLFNFGIMHLGIGDDKILGIRTTNLQDQIKDRYSGHGIENRGGLDKGVWIRNANTIDTGEGDDEIKGIGNVGVSNTSLMSTGDGKDSILGIGGSIGILNEVEIDTGLGADYIKGEGAWSGITNNGTINTGDGDDIVDAIKGGFRFEHEKFDNPRGRGILTLGNDNDCLLGFGTGEFDGGDGVDIILLPEGLYEIGTSSITKHSEVMRVSGFEKFGGINGGVFSFAPATINVGPDGIAINNISIGPTPPTASVGDNNNSIANTGTINNSGTIHSGTINTNSGNTTNNTNSATNNITNITYVYFNSGNTTSNSGNTTTYTNSGNTLNTWNVIKVDTSVKAGDIVNQWFGNTTSAQKQVQDITDTKLMDIVASSWSDKVQINRVAKASDNGDVLEGKQRDSNVDGVVGSVLTGGKGSDRIQAMSGWDLVEGGEGNDLVRAGNGRDILTGGSGKDELWGGFGWNTYKGDKDGSEDLLVIKSDEWQVNSLNGKAGNNPDGSKCDIIEALDSIDKIIMQGVNTSDLRFAGNVTGQGLVGIGIYAKGALEALYTGGDLTVAQLTAMTTGDITGPANGTYWSW